MTDHSSTLTSLSKACLLRNSYSSEPVGGHCPRRGEVCLPTDIGLSADNECPEDDRERGVSGKSMPDDDRLRVELDPVLRDKSYN